ncbi:hypothetical protein [Enterobacter cloacae]|uniref:Uncharacterized protein n=1 Tax=Enterobacter cloacae TaxID=550 RepID=A0A330G6H3_ENTCL|nr:hypothetical protein [Enterobacter cloacae]RAZ62653.1 hypothetical protein DP202_22810 [Enterobacter cloacae]
MSYQWNKFGKLEDVALGEKYVILMNGDNKYKKMARYTYKERALEVYQKAKKLIGIEVTLRTSQNTAEWPPEIWFSEIKKTD